ncbi:hypothetical protein FOB64_006035 [Candida albicans]|uniref:ERT1/acuK family PAS domain-containing protein n=1 Tax=Candida albicans TaxID=5476 RepID=A0A8H6BSV9_CANAX|nr:hypothetical protein FOB64_006035 [Candida albicans]
MTKKLTPQEKKNRKPAVRANCVKRNIAHGCQDIVRKRVKYLTGEGVPGAVSNKQSTPRKKLKTGPVSTSVSPMDSVKSELTTPVESSNHFPPPMSSSVDALPTTQHSAIEIPPNDQPISDILEVPPLFDSSHMISSEAPETNITLTTQNLITPDPLSFHTNTVSNTTTDVLNKLLNDNYKTESMLKYMMLGDIILQSKQASPSPSNTSTSENNTNTLSPSSFGYISNINFEDFNQPKRKVVQKLKDSRPFISLGFTADLAPHDNNNNTDYYDDKMTNNITGKTEEGPGNPIINYNTKFTTDYVPPSITNNLYKTASDLYSKELKNFYYPLSYHALTKLLKVIFGGNDLSPEEKQEKRSKLLIILKLIASYRPTFIAAHRDLIQEDLLMLEMTLQRSLLDYKKLAELNSSPTIMWRRTGEIISITEDMALLLEHSSFDLLKERRFIFELMDDNSIVDYFNLFANIAVGNLKSVIQTAIQMKTKSSNLIKFTCVFTIKRDIFDIPMIVIGQFLPIV